MAASKAKPPLHANGAGSRIFALDVPFSMRPVAQSAGAVWDKDHKVFLFRGGELPPALVPFRAPRYSLERAVEHELNDSQPEADDAALPSGEPITLRPHQTEAVKAILAARKAGRPGFLLADDVGLGKTISSWQAVLSMGDVRRVLVVCPLAVIAHWRRTIERMRDRTMQIIVINYDRLAKLFEVPTSVKDKVKSKKGVAKRGEPEHFDVIVWDESHRCKNPTAARSKLAAKLTAKAGFSLWLSATAGQNPLELSYLAPLLANGTGSRAADLKDFETWCWQQGLGVERGAYGKWLWRGEQGDCERVRTILFDGQPALGIRRCPENIVGWPAINRILAPVALEGEARALYERAWMAFRKEMELIPRGSNPKNALTAMLRFRQKSSLVRASGTVALVLELLESGQQVAVSVAFAETLEAIARELEGQGIRCARVHGALGAQERETARLAFQRGENLVVLFTVEEGISLHQGEHNETPRSEIVHDLRWSAIQMAQIEGRCHRDGRFAQVYWAYADGTIEERIATIVCERLRAMKAMTGDDTETVEELASLLSDAAGCPP
jgi:hypothetical protein